MYIGLHVVKYPLFISNFSETWIFLTDFRKILINIKFHENPSSRSSVVPCGQTDGQSDVMKLILWMNLKMVTLPLFNTTRFWWWWVIYRYNLLLLDLLHRLTDFLEHYVSEAGSASIFRQYATDLLDPLNRDILGGTRWLRTAGSKGSNRLGTSCLKTEAEQAFKM